MSISYNYFLPTNIYGTLRVTDLGFPGYTAVNANIYCQRNINSDGQMQCGSFKSLGASVFDQVPTCITNATTATQLTNYQTVQGLITASGGITLQQAIDGVHASSQQFTVPQNIWNTLTFRTAGGSASTTVLQHADSIGYFILTNTSSTGHYRFNLNTAGVQSTVLEMDSTTAILRSGTVQLNLTTVNALTCSNNATFNGAYPTTTLGLNSGSNNNEFATVGYAKSIGGTSILGLNNIFTGTNTFNIPIISSGASLASNSINSASIVNNSITNTQIATGFQLVNTSSQTFSGIKTLSSLLNSTGIADTVSISTPIMNAGYFVATSTTGTSSLYGTFVNGQLTANSLNTTLITDSSATLPVAVTFPLGSIPLFTGTTGDSRAGFLIGWNGLSGSNGETDFTNLNQGGNQGGFLFNNIPVGGSLQKLASLLPLNAGGLRLYPYCGNLRVDDNTNGAFSTNIRQDGALSIISSAGINTSLFLQCGNGIGDTTNVFQVSTGGITPLVNLNPTSTTTFNASHPTSTLPLPTLSNQYATVGYVTSAISTASLIPLNNIWTGLNTYTQRIQMTIKTSTSTTCIGTNAGASLGTLASNTNSTYYGFNAGVFSVNPQSETIIGAASGPIVTGSFSNNTVVGANSVFNGSGNTILGATSGNTSTTTVYNNSTTIGIGVLMTASNQITIGRNTETVLIPGATNINGTLTTTGTTNINNTTMTGTTIVNNDLQVNGNITRATGGFLIGAVQTTFTTIPPYIIFIPVVGMSFVLPAPSAANAGQMFVIRRFGTGVGNPTIIFTCVGNLAVWVPLNSNATNTSLAISTIWQFTIISAQNLYITIA